MKIVTVPHPALRKTASPVENVDAKLISFVVDLQQTLADKQNPPGVGLAAPQVKTAKRIFATKLPNPAAGGSLQLRYFINPVITSHSAQEVLGENPQDPDLEGCLSIPEIYGPIPRWDWIEVEYQSIKDDRLQSHRERFVDFPARVVQHEIDHLDGILFIDYSLELDLPVYQSTKTGQLVEVDRRIIEVM